MKEVFPKSIPQKKRNFNKIYENITVCLPETKLTSLITFMIAKFDCHQRNKPNKIIYFLVSIHLLNVYQYQKSIIKNCFRMMFN